MAFQKGHDHLLINSGTSEDSPELNFMDEELSSLPGGANAMTRAVAVIHNSISGTFDILMANVQTGVRFEHSSIISVLTAVPHFSRKWVTECSGISEMELLSMWFEYSAIFSR